MSDCAGKAGVRKRGHFTWRVFLGTSVTDNACVGGTDSTNRDSSACAKSTFGLQASAPAGWTAAFANSSLTISPGATASTTLRVTSPAGTTDGCYTIGVSATNSAATGCTGSSSATYVIAPAVTLSMTVATDKASYSRNQTVLEHGRRDQRRDIRWPTPRSASP